MSSDGVVETSEADNVKIYKPHYGFRNLFNSFLRKTSMSKQQREESQVIPKLSFDSYAAASQSSILLQTPNNNLKSVLDRGQLEMCANVWANDGIVRRSINELTHNIQPDRSKYAVSLNDELIDSLVKAKLEIKQREVFGEDDSKVIKLRQNLFRANKRCKFFQNTNKGMKKCFVYGRSGLEITRFPKMQGFNKFGEPKSITPLYSTRIVGAFKKEKQFGGFLYDDPEQIDKTENRKINAVDLIPFFHDDDGIFENTDYSGLSMIWPLLSVSQSNEVINDEDLPASVRQLWAKMGHLYTGDEKDSTTEGIMKKWLAGTILIHHKKDLKMEVYDLARDLMEIINVRKGNAEFILWCIGLPAFFLLTNIANFATADKEGAIFKAGVVQYYRTWLRGIYEDYWYDPQLADFLDVPIEQVIAADLKVKAVFEDLIYDSKLDLIQGEQILNTIGAHDAEDTLEILGEDAILEKKREIAKIQAKTTQDSINQEVQKRQAQGLPPFNKANNSPVQPLDNANSQPNNPAN